MFGEEKLVEIAIDEIRGYLEPSDAERAAAYELVVELATRTTTAPLRESEGTIRETMDSLHEVFPITREILKRHGLETSKGSAGNLSMAVLAVRVLNEVIRPVLSEWHAELRAHEAKRRQARPAVGAVEWERHWEQAARCRADLTAIRHTLRAYVDTLSRIAGAPEIGDAVQAPPASIMFAAAAGLDRPSHGTRDWRDAKPRKRMFRWMDLIEGTRMALSTFKADDRLEPGPAPSGAVPTAVFTADENEEFWFDYAADMGDGFDGTMPVAWLIGREQLTLPDDPWGELPSTPAGLPRGELLVFGGDEVYPNAFPGVYENQLELPYRLGVERPDDADERPTVVAIPGNHDWMGGLKYFEEIFTRGRDFADFWKTVQPAPYWHVKLPQGWWLWGIDTKLDNRLPPEQETYFTEAAELLREGDRVIMCTPVPLWQMRQKHLHDYRDLRTFFDRVIGAHGATAPLWLSGDSHYFAHFERTDVEVPEDHLTAGGAGAFLQPTHNLPERIPLEKGATEFEMTSRWPRPADSRALAPGASNLLKESQYWLASLLMGGLFAGVVGLSHIGWWFGGDGADGEGQNWLERLRDVVVSPAAVLVLVIIAGSTLAVKANSTESKVSSAARAYGVISGVAVAAVAVAGAALFHWLDDWPWWLRWPLGVVVVGLAMFAAFLTMATWTNARIKANTTLAFSHASSTRYKHFLRFRIDLQGVLTCYCVGIDPVGEGWIEAMEQEQPIPPFDRAGIPRVHYVWGKRYEKFRPTPLDVAVSISDPSDPEPRSRELFERLSEMLLRQGHTLMYGGLPDRGYTTDMWEIEQRVHEDNPNAENHLVNYVADYLWDPDFRVKPKGSMKRVHVSRRSNALPGSTDEIIDDLTAMRHRMNRDADVRIVFAGNRTPGPQGSRLAPGVVEEAYLAVRSGLPLLVAGGFGGAGALIADALLGELDRADVDEEILHFVDDETRGDRPSLTDMLEAMTTPALLRNGLTSGENEELLRTKDVTTAMLLIRRSIRRLGARVG